MNAIDLKNRTAIVTGGARGIGFAAAQKMLASGAAVALWDIDAAALAKAAAALKGGGRVHTARRRCDRREPRSAKPSTR